MPASLLTRQPSEMEITPFQLMMMPLSHIAGWAPDRHVSESKKKQRWAWDRIIVHIFRTE